MNNLNKTEKISVGVVATILLLLLAMVIRWLKH